MKANSLSTSRFLAVLCFLFGSAVSVTAGPAPAPTKVTTATSQPSASAALANDEYSANVVNDRLAFLSDRIRVIENELRDEEKRAVAFEAALDNERRARETKWLWIVTIVGAVGVLLFAKSWTYLRRRLLEPAVERALQTAIESELQTLRRTLLERTETDLISFARLLALVDASQHDAALAAFGWKDDVTQLRSAHPALRRAIITALYGADGRNEETRRANREFAWQAVQELMAEKHEAADLRLYLMIATKLSRYSDAVSVVQREMGQLVGDKQSVTRAATIMRRVGKTDEAVRLLETIDDSDDLAVVVTRAALLRDIGRFDDAHTVLLPAVQRIIKLQPERIDEGEARVINTYVANCIDRHGYEDGRASATLILEKLATIRPVEIATCGRLLVKLKESGSLGNELLDAYGRRIAELPKSDTKVQATVSWHLLLNEANEAERQLTDEIARADERLAEGSKKESDRRSAYFFRCILGELMLKRHQPDLASEVFMQATTLDSIGEAQFHLAKCELLRGDSADAVRWLTQAISMLPKWRQLAINDDILGKDGVVMASLTSHAASGSSETPAARSQTR